MPAFGQLGENTHRFKLKGGHAGRGAHRLFALYLLWCRLARGAAKKHSYPLVRHIVCP